MIVRVALAVLALVAALLAVPAIRHWREQPPPAPPPIRLALPVPERLEPGSGGDTLDAAISPDESQVVFVATSDGVRRLWRRRLEEERAEPLAGTDDGQLPAWKQTGNVIAFFAGGRLKQITLGDALVHDLAEAPAPAGASWLRDGSLVFAAAAGPIRRMREGRIDTVTTLAPGDVTHAYPVAVTGSNDFVYVAVRDNGRRIVRLAAAGQERDLITTSAHGAIVGNYLLHVRDGALLAYRLDPESGRLAPRGMPLALDVGVSGSGRGLFAASERLLVYAPSAPRPHELAWLDPSGTRAGTIGDSGEYWQVRLSPDDRFAAVTATDPLIRGLDILVLPAEGTGDPHKLTLALAADSDPVWSPDGTRILFRSMQSGTPDLFVKRAFASDAAAQSTFRSAADETPSDWREDDILFHARSQGGVDILRLDAITATSTPVADTAFNESDGRWSPDGRWMAFVSDESGRPDVYAREAGGTRLRVSFGGGTRPRWTRDGALVFTRGSQVLRAERAGGRFAAAQVMFDAPGLRDFDTAHRGDRLLAVLPVSADQSVTISVVMNWRSALTN